MLLLAPMMAAAIIVPQVDRLTVALAVDARADERAAERVLTAKVDVLIAPDGSPKRCDFVLGSGSREAADRACADFRAHRYTPRPSIDGAPTYALLRVTVIQVAISRANEHFSATPDATLSVNRLPGGAMKATEAVVLAVDENNHVTTCAPDPRTEHPALAGAICAATQLLDLRAVSGARGKPLAYVTRRRVDLVVTTIPE